MRAGGGSDTAPGCVELGIGTGDAIGAGRQARVCGRGWAALERRATWGAARGAAWAPLRAAARTCRRRSGRSCAAPGAGRAPQTAPARRPELRVGVPGGAPGGVPGGAALERLLGTRAAPHVAPPVAPPSGASLAAIEAQSSASCVVQGGALAGVAPHGAAPWLGDEARVPENSMWQHQSGPGEVSGGRARSAEARRWPLAARRLAAASRSGRVGELASHARLETSRSP